MVKDITKIVFQNIYVKYSLSYLEIQIGSKYSKENYLI